MRHNLLSSSITMAPSSSSSPSLSLSKPTTTRHRHHKKPSHLSNPNPSSTTTTTTTTNTTHCSSSLCKHPSATDDILIFIFILVFFSGTYLITSYIVHFLFVLLDSSLLRFFSFLLFFLFLVFSFVICCGNRSRKCHNPSYKGLKKAMELDLLLQTEDWLRSPSAAVSEFDKLPWKGGTEGNPDYECLMAELRKMAPPNGWAVLSCACPVAKLEGRAAKRGRRHKNPTKKTKRSPIVRNWVKGQLLGRGLFGSVYEGIADRGFFIAVKEASLLDQGEQSISQLEQEIALLSQFEHENIVRYYGTDKDESNLYIFLELATKGSLLSLYRKYNLPDSIVSLYTRQILHGLKYLHERNVVHRDIKCANILVHANGSVKLADFGLAKATKLNDIKSSKGSPYWMAPEVVKRNDQGYGLPADIWSLGCTVLEMLTRQVPYVDLEPMQALFRIGRGVPPPVPDSLSRDARDFILRCLQVDPNDRPSAADLLDHPYVRRPLPSSSGSSSPYNFGQRV